MGSGFVKVSARKKIRVKNKNKKSKSWGESITKESDCFSVQIIFRRWLVREKAVSFCFQKRIVTHHIFSESLKKGNLFLSQNISSWFCSPLLFFLNNAPEACSITIPRFVFTETSWLCHSFWAVRKEPSENNFILVWPQRSWRSHSVFFSQSLMLEYFFFLYLPTFTGFAFCQADRVDTVIKI